MIQNTNIDQGHKEHSVSPKSYVRIKSAHPLKFDREKLIEENISLKNQLNKIRNDIVYSKKEIVSLESEISKKDRIIEDMMNESQIDASYSKASETHLVINLKKQYKELKRDNEKLQLEIETLKRNIKSTKINELQAENKILMDQAEKLKGLYDHSKEQNQSIESNYHTITIMKEALNKQDMVILNFQENYSKMQEEIKSLIIEREKLSKAKNEKMEMISKLKQKLKLQYQINEKLVLRKDNIKNTDEYLEMKNKFEKTLQQCRKDLALYKDLNSKNERMLRETKKMQNDKEKTLNSFYSSRSAICPSNNHQQSIIHNEGGSSDQNSKLLLLQSKYLEQKAEKEQYQKQITELVLQLENTKKPIETKVVLATSNSNKKLIRNVEITEYEYMSEYNLNEFIYILIKNLEANKLDMSIIESRVLTTETLHLLKTKEDNYKEFISSISTSLCEIIKIYQDKDQAELHSFIRTFLYNYYISKKSSNPEEFKLKLLALFDNINFYSIEQKTELNHIICKKLSKSKNELMHLLEFFDSEKSGYITFTILKKIMEELKIKLKNETLEYFIYIMKCFPEEGRYLRDLKYDNLLKILDEVKLGVNDEEVKDNDNDNDNDNEKDKEDDEAIEITNEEYLNKVNEIIGKIVAVLNQKNKKIDDYFINQISKSFADYRGIELIKLVDVLRKDFNIELTHIEIFCLFTKVKPGTSMSKDYDDTIEEIIDFDKLKNEIEKYQKIKPKAKPKQIDQKKKKGKKANDSNSDDSDEGNNAKRKPLSYSEICNKAKQEKIVNETEDVKEILLTFMKKHHMTFERFIFPIHCMMKIASNGKKFNRYIDIEFFKHFLYQNGLLIHSDDLIYFCSQDQLMLNNEMLNIDYLKFILSGQKGIRDNKVNEFMLYKPFVDRNNTTYKATCAMSHSGMDNNGNRMLKNELYGDDDNDDELVHITKKA